MNLRPVSNELAQTGALCPLSPSTMMLVFCYRMNGQMCGWLSKLHLWRTDISSSTIPSKLNRLWSQFCWIWLSHILINLKNLERETFSLFWQQSIPKFQLCDPCADFDEKKKQGIFRCCFPCSHSFSFFNFWSSKCDSSYQ